MPLPALLKAALCSFLLLFARVTHAGSSQGLVPRTWNGTKCACKCYYDDNCWPSKRDWADFNETVDGNLFVDVPPGAACHDTFHGPLGTIPTYNAAACASVTANFSNEQWTIDQPAAELWTYWTNETCRPTADPADPCTLGYYPVYGMLARTHAHVKSALDFARDNSLRLVVRNTGHDFIGRSTGWGALVINTHAFQEYSFVDSYDGPCDYDGPAVTLGAGVEGQDVLRVCHARSPPLAVVTGECPTVVQGGGHGPWTTLRGFAADNALEFKALTADGDFVTANSDENPDLYWALRGGGPGTFAVFLSTTYAVFEDLPSAGMILNINKQLQAVVQPLFDGLAAMGLAYSAVTKEYATFFDLHIDMFEDETAGQTSLTGGWTFVQRDVASNNDAIVDAFQTALLGTPYPALVLGHMWDAGHGAGAAPDSAVNPRVRNSSSSVIVGMSVASNASLADKAAAQHALTYVIDDALCKAGPNGCAYVNEADPFQPDWQHRFWGTNYGRLRAIREKWDPGGVFYAVSTPGTEDWVQIEYGTRLCKRVR